MGLDSYIFKTTRNEQEEYENFCEEHEKLQKELEDFLAEKKNEFPKLTEFNGEDVLTGDNLSKYKDIVKKLFEHMYENTECNELVYWRKAWCIHSYIADRFGDCNKSDNCERIILTRENVESLIADLKFEKNTGVKEMFEDTEYWNSERLDYTIEKLEAILDEFDDDHVIYYYAWY